VDLKDPASRSRYIQPLNRENTRTIDRTGGTYLHTSLHESYQEAKTATCTRGAAVLK